MDAEIGPPVYYAGFAGWLAFDAGAPRRAVAVISIVACLAAVAARAGTGRFGDRLDSFGCNAVDTWGDRLWLALIVAALVGLSVWFSQFDAHAHLGAIILASIATGVGAIALLVGGERYSPQIGEIAPSTIVKVLLVAAVASIPISVALDSAVPAAIVAGYGGWLAIHLMWQRR